MTRDRVDLECPEVIRDSPQVELVHPTKPAESQEEKESRAR